MAKLFDTADAERLIQEHRMMLEELDEIAQYEDNVQIDIEKAANLVVTRNVLDVLRDIPVEEINREKGGFRVKALRYCCGQCVFDQFGAWYQRRCSVFHKAYSE